MIGERTTPQREAILAAFMSSHRPLSPHSLVRLLNRSSKRVSIATAYRNINALAEQGFLVAVKIPGEHDHYERSGLPPHAHFFCQKCKMVYCTPTLKEPVPPPGFKMKDWSLLMTGICKSCAK